MVDQFLSSWLNRSMKPWFSWLFVLMLLLSSCKPSSPLPTPIPGTQPPNLPVATAVGLHYENLNVARALWQEKGPGSYRLTLRTTSLWHLQTITLRVKDGVVIESSAECQPAPNEGRTCQVAPYVAEDYTVPALFTKVQSTLSYPGSELLSVSYDPDLGYPFYITYDDPQVLDEEWVWEVLEFEP